MEVQTGSDNCVWGYLVTFGLDSLKHGRSACVKHPLNTPCNVLFLLLQLFHFWEFILADVPGKSKWDSGSRVDQGVTGNNEKAGAMLRSRSRGQQRRWYPLDVSWLPVATLVTKVWTGRKMSGHRRIPKGGKIPQGNDVTCACLCFSLEWH